MSEEHNFEAFMAAYQDMVYSTAMRLLSNSAEAEDISQEVFLKAYDRFAELSQSKTAGGWLKTVTRNMCLNHLSRYRARWTFFSDLKKDDDDDREFDIAAEDTQSADAELGDEGEHVRGGAAAVQLKGLVVAPEAELHQHFPGVRPEAV